jgi:small neutral amino acid transporter SnatA (MarC family)
MNLHPEQFIEAAATIISAAITGAFVGLGFFLAALIFTSAANALHAGLRVGEIVAGLMLVCLAVQTIHEREEE